MRARPFVLLTLLPILVAHSQNSSTRLSGMGNISIAVVDSESEVFSNPAKASWLGTGLLRFSPFYSGTSNDYSYNDNPGVAGYSPSTSSQSLSDRQYNLPVGVIIPVSNFRFGGAASLGRMTDHQESKTWTGGTSPSSSNNTQDVKNPSKALSLMGSMDLGWGSIGVAGSWGSNSEEIDYLDNYPLSTLSYSYENVYTEDQTNHVYTFGLLFGPRETAQVSLMVGIEGNHLEMKPTRAVSNGIPQDLSLPDISLQSETGTRFEGEVRKSYEGNVLAALRVSYRTSSNDQSEKYQWPTGPTLPVYMERPTGHTDEHAWRLGFGISKQVEGTGIFSAEYVYSPTGINDKSYYTMAGTTADGRTYVPGQESSTTDETVNIQEIRVGIELRLLPELIARGGAEVMWANDEYTSRSLSYSETTTMSGRTAAQFYGAGGLSYYVGPVRIDYSFGMVPYSWYNYSSPYSTQALDIALQHTATVSYQF